MSAIFAICRPDLRSAVYRDRSVLDTHSNALGVSAPCDLRHSKNTAAVIASMKQARRSWRRANRPSKPKTVHQQSSFLNRRWTACFSPIHAT